MSTVRHLHPDTGRDFRWKSVLVKPHHGPQACDICGTRDEPRSWLAVVYETGHSDRRLMCGGCIAAFLRSDGEERA